ncbi:hypothetical protein [Bradyrhizobium japonicum]|uniref:hypothetical protein n=1 Tax=Bradyrhizobium japonicum TaxID=375 RepID=UPI002715430F|nr:hypothetical protein [Bradyrhizobium japonicum]WLB24462.1 hypothetical protein QIH95_50395 [Bradyrhizobium japonicum]
MAYFGFSASMWRTYSVFWNSSVTSIRQSWPGASLPSMPWKDLPGRYRGFLPRSMLVGEFLAFVVDLMAFVRDVKEVPRHASVMLPSESRSYFGVCNPGDLAH